MKPVGPRVPWRSALLVLVAGAVLPIASLASRGPRRDLLALPTAWVAITALLWLGGLLCVLVAATLPRPGYVLPDTTRAARATWLVATALVVYGLIATVDAPGHTIMPARTFTSFAHWWWHCSLFSLKTMAPPLLVGALLLRGLFPLGGARVAAALGAAAGATSGLTLHFLCPIGGGLHVGLAHAGAIVIGALAGGLLLGRLLRS